MWGPGAQFPTNFFFSNFCQVLTECITNQMKKKFKIVFFSSKVFKCTWKMQNVLKRTKNQISDYYFSSYGQFCIQNNVNFRLISMISLKKKSEIIFFSFLNYLDQNGSFWGRGGVCRSLTRKFPIISKCLFIHDVK